ncbi:MBL fold metallo-hydrolase [Psychrobacter sp.]|uniref:MBL fold metallo-hydrolase n=1 Tax=Psychrobacter sp. TaxID=56811 RepID=UPI0025CC8BC6|nr:MBL fold metallo-hydrolase [Psychrobacter sp.]
MTSLFLKFAPTFGGKPSADTIDRITNSPNFNGKTFVNLPSSKPFALQTVSNITPYTEGTQTHTTQSGNFLWQFLFPPKGKNPSHPIDTLPLNLKQKISNNVEHHPYDNTLKDGEFVWLGHSTVLFRISGKLLMTDPVFHSASPVPFFVKPFKMTNPPKAEDLPFVDAVLISHDHYDHLDHKAVKKLTHKVGHFYVPLGVKSHLIRWGVLETNISEYDWYECTTIAGNPSFENDGDINITFAPTKHFSGRRLTGQNTSLWGSWAVQSKQLSVYFSGDGGYSEEFAKIGERFGGFDVAFIEDGAYNQNWRNVHMMPEESAQAGIDVKAKVVLPIHWGKFDLSVHHWREPVRRLKSAFDTYNSKLLPCQRIRVTTPRIGEVFTLDNLPSAPWWEQES